MRERDGESQFVKNNLLAKLFPKTACVKTTDENTSDSKINFRCTGMNACFGWQFVEVPESQPRFSQMQPISYDQVQSKLAACFWNAFSAQSMLRFLIFAKASQSFVTLNRSYWPFCPNLFKNYKNDETPIQRYFNYGIQALGLRKKRAAI